MTMPGAAAATGRPRLQFKLRTLMLAMTLAAVGLGWTASRARERQQAASLVASWGGSVQYRATEGSFAGWIRDRLGRDYIDDVTAVYVAGGRISDDDLAVLARFTRLETLSLVSTPLTDGCLRHLRVLRSLDTLDLRFTQIAPAGIESLRADLPQTKIYGKSDIE